MSKKVSTKTVENLMKLRKDSFPKTVPLTFKLDDKDITFNIKTSLSIAERTTFISRVGNSIFFDEQCHIEYFEPLFDITLLQLFTDIPVFQDGENLNMDKTIDLCKFLKIRNTISSLLTNDTGYISDLYHECKEVVEFKKQQMIAEIANKPSLSDEVLENINGSIVKFNKVIDSIKSSVENMDMSKGKDLIEMAMKMNKAGLNDSGEIIDAIVKNASTQNNDENEQNAVANEQKDNVTPISPIEG